MNDKLQHILLHKNTPPGHCQSYAYCQPLESRQVNTAHASHGYYNDGSALSFSISYGYYPESVCLL